MNKYLAVFCILCSSVAVAEDAVKTIPNFYLRPELYMSYVEHNQSVISNGYVLIDDVKTAQKFFDHLPPEVNFDSEKIVVFVWSGSGQDKIDHEKIDDTYHFVFKRGMTRDLRHHVLIVSIPKKYDWLFHRVYD